MARNSLQYIDIFNCDGENTRESKATGAKVFRLESSFCRRFLLSLARILMLGSLRPSLVRIVFLQRVVSEG